ncbi:DNA cytosine methyltransferase [Listeria monocytogenes]|nr:DNA cytosine methyltransferase [Listeria monocytogenes]
MKTLSLFSLFSGIGAFEKALDRLEIKYELVAYCDNDPPASKSYAAIHGVDESMNLGDITKVDEKKLPKDIDLLTYGFPCQDISNSGKQKGLLNPDGSRTRSGLFFDAQRIIEEVQPVVAIAENVKNLTSKKFAEQFKIVLESLEQAGYNNYWAVLNAKAYGIPQNRERVFIVSIRKDVDPGCFRFPEGFPLEVKLMDLLEVNVSDELFIETPYDLVSIRSNGVFVKEATRKGYTTAGVGDSINLEFPNSKTRRGRVGRQVAQTLTTSPQQVVVVANMGELPKLRKLSAKECFRLMGFDDSDFEKAASVVSDRQLYKQAGNSIVVNVIQHIIQSLIECGVLQNSETERELTPDE